MIRTPETIAEAKVKNMDVAKPQSNMYPQSSAVVEANIKSQAATLGHNAFRPDIYRVTEGMVS